MHECVGGLSRHACRSAVQSHHVKNRRSHRVELAVSVSDGERARESEEMQKCSVETLMSRITEKEHDERDERCPRPRPRRCISQPQHRLYLYSHSHSHSHSHSPALSLSPISFLASSTTAFAFYSTTPIANSNSFIVGNDNDVALPHCPTAPPPTPQRPQPTDPDRHRHDLHPPVRSSTRISFLPTFQSQSPACY
jgi:hypothetical protein